MLSESLGRRGLARGGGPGPSEGLVCPAAQSRDEALGRRMSAPARVRHVTSVTRQSSAPAAIAAPQPQTRQPDKARRPRPCRGPSTEPWEPLILSESLIAAYCIRSLIPSAGRNSFHPYSFYLSRPSHFIRVASSSYPSRSLYLSRSGPALDCSKIASEANPLPPSPTTFPGPAGPP